MHNAQCCMRSLWHSRERDGLRSVLGMREVCRDGIATVVQLVLPALRRACGGQVNAVLMVVHILVLPQAPFDGGRCVHNVDW